MAIDQPSEDPSLSLERKNLNEIYKLWLKSAKFVGLSDKKIAIWMKYHKKLYGWLYCYAELYTVWPSGWLFYASHDNFNGS